MKLQGIKVLALVVVLVKLDCSKHPIPQIPGCRRHFKACVGGESRFSYTQSFRHWSSFYWVTVPSSGAMSCSTSSRTWGKREKVEKAHWVSTSLTGRATAH